MSQSFIEQNYYFIKNINWQISLMKKWDENNLKKYIFLDKIKRIYLINDNLFILWSYYLNSEDDDKVEKFIIYKYGDSIEKSLIFTETYTVNENYSYVNPWEWGWQGFSFTNLDPKINKNNWDIIFSIMEEELSSEWIWEKYLKWFSYNEKEEIFEDKIDDNYLNDNIENIDFNKLKMVELNLYSFNFSLNLMINKVDSKNEEVIIFWVIDEWIKLYMEKISQWIIKENDYLELIPFVSKEEDGISLSSDILKDILNNLKIIENKKLKLDVDLNKNVYNLDPHLNKKVTMFMEND